ncbi:unnamed protein product [Lupinus luteus]|uniref:Uncharacterized protein n=1 Tax=Lupinus luteus TaxID=3873 RepID=A0AAV1Y0L6_LUPLU
MLYCAFESSNLNKMVIIRDIVNDFSDDEEIELCDDDNDIEATEPGSITYANPSSFFVNVDFAADQDIDYISSHLSNEGRWTGLHVTRGPYPRVPLMSWTLSTSPSYTSALARETKQARAQLTVPTSKSWTPSTRFKIYLNSGNPPIEITRILQASYNLLHSNTIYPLD